MGRRELREELQATWMVMREPRKAYESRAQRRRNLAVARREAKAAEKERPKSTMEE